MKLDQFQGVNAGYVLELYDRFRRDPGSVDPETRAVFERWTPDEGASAVAGTSLDSLHAIVGAANLAESIRRYGHLGAQLDPLGSAPAGDPSLSAGAHGVSEQGLAELPADLVGGPVAID